MMLIMVKSDDVRSGRKANSRHGRLRAAQESMVSYKLKGDDRGGGVFALFLRPHPGELPIFCKINANAWGLARGMGCALLELTDASYQLHVVPCSEVVLIAFCPAPQMFESTFTQLSCSRQ